MIASSIKNTKKTDAQLLKQVVVQTDPAVALNVQAIESAGSNKAKVTVDTLTITDVPVGTKVKISDTTNHDGIYLVESADYDNEFIVIVGAAINSRPEQTDPAGTVELFGSYEIYIDGVDYKNDFNEVIGYTYTTAGSFVKEKGDDSLAMHIGVVSGSMTVTFYASIDGLTWSALSGTTLASITDGGTAFFNDIPNGTKIRADVTGTGTYYMLARG